MANRPLLDTAVRGDLEDGVSDAPALSASVASGAAGGMVVGSGSRSPPGVLLLRQTGTPQAEAATWLRRALDVAQCQEAKSPELRAAMSLGQMWQQQGKRTDAYDLLASIYGWFTEGCDTTDLQEAKALLETLM